MPLTQEHLLRLARHGAEARVRELQAEIDAIRQTFPDLGSPGRRSGLVVRKQSTVANPSATAPDQPARSRRRGWSATQRKAAAERMKAYWANRKAGSRKK